MTLFDPRAPLLWAKSARSWIAYRVFGSGDDVLLFIHGGFIPVRAMTEDRHFGGFLRRLASFRKVIVCDLGGIGRSDETFDAAGPSLASWAQDVLTALDAEQASKVDVLGNDTGGQIALTLAATHPDRVGRLVVVNSYKRLPPGAPVRDKSGSWIDEMWEGLAGDAAGHLGPSIASDKAFQRWWIGATQEGAHRSTASVIADATERADVGALLPRVRTPVLVLHRAGNRYIPSSEGRALAEALPTATFVELPGPDHWIYVGDVEQLTSHVQQFLTGVGEDPAPVRSVRAILFTDIVGSTDTAVERGDSAWLALLDAHREAVRRVVAVHGGEPVRTEGDACVATFANISAAVRCAARILVETTDLELHVRAGIHAAEVDYLGDAPSGIGFHIAARVMAEAEADEVLTSETVRYLLEGSEFIFRQRGVVKLKGVPMPRQLFRVDVGP